MRGLFLIDYVDPEKYEVWLEINNNSESDSDDEMADANFASSSSASFPSHVYHRKEIFMKQNNLTRSDVLAYQRQASYLRMDTLKLIKEESKESVQAYCALRDSESLTIRGTTELTEEIKRNIANSVHNWETQIRNYSPDEAIRKVLPILEEKNNLLVEKSVVNNIRKEFIKLQIQKLRNILQDR